MTVRLANGPVSWGVDFAEAPGNPPWEIVFDQIAEAGFSWTELGPIGYLPQNQAQLRDELDRRGLQVAGSFVFQPLHRAEALDEVLEATRATCRLISAVGGRNLVIIDLVEDERVRTAGQSDRARRLNLREWQTLINGIRAVASVAIEEFELQPVFHPHVGSYIEFEDEVEAALDALEPDLCQLCLDTGHSAYAGIDPVALYRRNRGRVLYFHFKDIDPEVRQAALEQGLDFWSAIRAGIFCPLGSGMVDFPDLAGAVEPGGFDGWATIEQDRDAESESSALADAVRSREFLESVGLGEAKAGQRS
jgi:inosose dehydratase